MKTLYVTRHATLQFQRYIGGGFESARRRLTEMMVAAVNGSDREHFVELRMPHLPEDAPWRTVADSIAFRAWVQPEGPLMVVTKLDRV